MKSSEEIILEEWKSLRDESIRSMTHRNTIISFGIGALGALFFTGANFYNNPSLVSKFLSFGIFYYLIPFLSVMTVVLWLGEAERMSRAGARMKSLEEKINNIYNDEVLGWETYLRKQRPKEGEYFVRRLISNTYQMWYPYIAVIVSFAGFFCCSVGIGIVLFYSLYNLKSWEVLLMILPQLTIFTVVHILIIKKGASLK